MPFFEYRQLTAAEMQSKTVSGKKINRIFEWVAPCSRNNGYFNEVCTFAMYALRAIRCLWLGRSCFILSYVPDLCQILSLETTAQKAVMPDANKFVRANMHGKTLKKLPLC